MAYTGNQENITKPKLIYYDMGKEVTAFTTTRQGGMGRGNYAEFNITHYCGDDPEVVKQNRMALCKLLDIEDNRLILPRQTHNTEICCVDENFLNLTAEERCEALEGVDAVVTNLPGICIGVSTADCIPVLIYDTVGHVVCAVHAGWRGTVARIVEKAIATMSAFYGSRPENIVAQIGPGIHLDSFEVGDEVYESFAGEGFNMGAIMKKNGTSTFLSVIVCKFFPAVFPIRLSFYLPFAPTNIPILISLPADWAFNPAVYSVES